MSDKCEIPRCGKPIGYTWLGVNICEHHWDEHCSVDLDHKDSLYMILEKRLNRKVEAQREEMSVDELILELSKREISNNEILKLTGEKYLSAVISKIKAKIGDRKLIKNKD